MTEMRQLEVHLNLNALLELKPRTAAEFCEAALDADTLVEELEEYGPFARRRKSFCEFLGIGESTLTGWLKEGRVPRAAKVAYVLLVGVNVLQAEVKRLHRDAHELKVIQDDETFHLVRFNADETGVSIGRIVARDIPNAKTARVLAGSLKAFRMLQETRNVIADMLERTENSRYIEDLQDLDTRIIKETLAAFEPDKWRELFRPVDLEELFDPSDKRAEARADVEANIEAHITLENGLTPSGEDAAAVQRERD
jgi:hypothetical protein